MLEKRDIDEAKKLFTEWDLHKKWDNSSPEYIDHCRKKAKDSLSLAQYLLEKAEKTEELEDNEYSTMWVVSCSYYSMFFKVEHLLGIEGKKLPKGTKDSHKTIYLAFLFY